MKPGVKRAVWFFLVLGSLFGLSSVSASTLVLTAGVNICYPAERTSGVKVRTARQIEGNQPCELILMSKRL